MQPTPGRDALIVGAGIGGLAAGLALRRAGWTVRVLERASNPRELGFALLLAPNATYALNQLGVADPVIAGGFVATGGEMRRPDGTTLKRFSLEQVRDLLPDPTVVVLRPVLHGTLLNTLGAPRGPEGDGTRQDEPGSDTLSLASEVTGFEQQGDRVAVMLADGRRMSARILIGADGVASVIRRQLHPGETPPRPSGLFGLRGVSHGVAHHLGRASGAQYFGRGIEAGVSRAGGDTVYWYFSVPAHVVASAGGTPQGVLERCLTPFHDSVRTIVSAASPEDMRLDELFDRPPLDAWGRGAVTLLGDAAHPMLPHAGQGAAQALEDAVALGRALATHGGPDEALRVYERVRAPRTAAIVRLARRSARLGSLQGVVSCWLRDALIRAAPERIILKQLVALGRPPEV